ncbi:c-type cytochrome domain-containing protein [Gemmata sp.]|uniref:c-type cytochrome domain-containing protein n=1 Tax=Gemmata sp. TaxID=1914242 RepID=UPI003F72D319
MESESLDEPVANPRKLSENGQMAAIGIYGFLVLVGFFFGIVTGYEKPRPAVAKKDETTKKDEPAKKDSTAAPKTQPPKTTTPNQPTGTVPNTQYTPEPDPKPKDEPKTEPDPRPEPKKNDPRTEEPKPEPKKVDPEPKKEEPKKELVSSVSFKDVHLILREHCASCHGNPPIKPKADVDVSTYDKVMKSPSGIGKLIVAGDLKKSGLWASIEDGSMPPDGKPKPTPKQLETLKNWILAGAKPRRRTVRGKRA